MMLMRNLKNEIATSLRILAMTGLVITFVLLGLTVHAQIVKPVKWSFTAKKVKADTYELHITATIDKTWKIYSGGTPDGGPQPTLVKFKPNAAVLLGGKVKEVGELHKVPEPAFGVDVWYYKDKVDFVQIIKVKRPMKQVQGDVLKGTVEFMACDASQCLPPEEVEFSIPLK
jgi:hypothetical protein